MSKDETLNVLKNVDLTEKTIKKKKIFLSHIIGKGIITFGNIETEKE